MPCAALSTITSKLQRLVGSKSNATAAAGMEKHGSHALQISAPFDFKHETISLPGLSEDDIATLKKRAAASRLGVGVGDNNGESSSAFGNPRQAPPAPSSPARPAAPTVLVTPSTPLSPKGKANAF
ncbi:hypothetical protein F4859DRAFT_515859 [Xylaria cf. heliscus]|nr:hypothetical protein F4859DRAFT_515859 [Xylaria cf. heliscus]